MTFKDSKSQIIESRTHKQSVKDSIYKKNIGKSNKLKINTLCLSKS